jgi:cell division protein FtsB
MNFDEELAALGKEFTELRKENARLKAQVERLKEDNRQLTNAFEIAEGIIKRMGKAAEAAAKEGKSSV